MLLSITEEAKTRRNLMLSPLFSDPRTSGKQTKFVNEYFFALEESSATIHLIRGESNAKKFQKLWGKDATRKFIDMGAGSIIKLIPSSRRKSEWSLMLKGYDTILTYSTEKTLEVSGHFGELVIYKLSDDQESMSLSDNEKVSISEWDTTEFNSKKPESVAKALAFTTSNTSMSQFLGTLSRTLTEVEILRATEAIKEALQSSVANYLTDEEGNVDAES